MDFLRNSLKLYESQHSRSPDIRRFINFLTLQGGIKCKGLRKTKNLKCEDQPSCRWVVGKGCEDKNKNAQPSREIPKRKPNKTTANERNCAMNKNSRCVFSGEADGKCYLNKKTDRCRKISKKNQKPKSLKPVQQDVKPKKAILQNQQPVKHTLPPAVETRVLLNACSVTRMQGILAGVQRDIYLVGERHEKLQPSIGNTRNVVDFYGQLFQDVKLPLDEKLDFYLEDEYGASNKLFGGAASSICLLHKGIHGIHCLRFHFRQKWSKNDNIRYHYNDLGIKTDNNEFELFYKFFIKFKEIREEIREEIRIKMKRAYPSLISSIDKYLDICKTNEENLLKASLFDWIKVDKKGKEQAKKQMSIVFDEIYKVVDKLVFTYKDGSKHSFFKRKYTYLPEIARYMKEYLLNTHYPCAKNYRGYIFHVYRSMIDIYTIARIMHHPEQTRIIYHAGGNHTKNFVYVMEKLGMKIIESTDTLSCNVNILKIETVKYPWFA